jgi:hypothetical protein
MPLASRKSWRVPRVPCSWSPTRSQLDATIPPRSSRKPAAAARLSAAVQLCEAHNSAIVDDHVLVVAVRLATRALSRSGPRDAGRLLSDFAGLRLGRWGPEPPRRAFAKTRYFGLIGHEAGRPTTAPSALTLRSARSRRHGDRGVGGGRILVGWWAHGSLRAQPVISLPKMSRAMTHFWISFVPS